MTYITKILTELREKRLWPVAVVLVVALIAVPTLLAKSSSPTPVAQLPQSAASGASAATAVPAVSVETTPTNSNLKDHSRDPFLQQKLAAAAKPASTSTTKTSTTSTTSAKSTTSTTSTTSTATGGTGSGSGSGSTTPVTIPTTKPKPAPTGLTATETYRVTIAMTNSSGGIDTTDSLERLSVLPSDRQPLLVELGVLRGGSRVLFAVQPGTVVKGGGNCVPGPVDCELISLAPNQTEGVFRQSATGADAVAEFAVTQIGVDRHSSVAATDKARRTESAAGRRLLNDSSLNALSLFHYDAGLGAVVDLRNLTVGGN